MICKHELGSSIKPSIINCTCCFWTHASRDKNISTHEILWSNNAAEHQFDFISLPEWKKIRINYKTGVTEKWTEFIFGFY